MIDFKLKETISSFMVGINQGIIGVPFDTVKVWMQNDKQVFGRPYFQYYRGFAPELANAIVTNSIVFNIRTFLNYRGRGFLMTAMRESVGYSMYFGSYSYFKEQGIPTFVAGALAGLCNWGTSFPFDTIMSRQVAQNISIKDAIRAGPLYRGYSVCLIRSICVNSFNFLVYENVKSLFE